MTHKELIKEINELPGEQRQALLEASWQSMLNKLSRVIYSWTKDQTATDDIIMETFERLFRYIGQKDREHRIKNLDAYLFRVARGLYLSRLQAERTSPDSKIRHSQAAKRDHKTLSQRLYGILKFDGDAPNDEELKDMISDYLIRKYS